MKKIILLFICLISISVNAYTLDVSKVIKENNKEVSLKNLEITKCFTHKYVHNDKDSFILYLSGDFLCQDEDLSVNSPYLKKKIYYNSIKDGVDVSINKRRHSKYFNDIAFLFIRILFLIVGCLLIRFNKGVNNYEKAWYIIWRWLFINS